MTRSPDIGAAFSVARRHVHPSPIKSTEEAARMLYALAEMLRLSQVFGECGRVVNVHAAASARLLFSGPLIMCTMNQLFSLIGDSGLAPGLCCSKSFNPKAPVISEAPIQWRADCWRALMFSGDDWQIQVRQRVRLR